MRKVGLLIFFIICSFSLTACGEEKAEINNKANVLKHLNVIAASLDKKGDIVINEDDVNDTATYINYEVDGVEVSFIAIKGTDGKVRLAFNTCQSCAPSPNAYFIQDGEYVECQNCGNRFYIDKIGEERGGCSPAPVDEATYKDGVIIIDSEYALNYIEMFANWAGPKLKS